jgi:hypothetical protein
MAHFTSQNELRAFLNADQVTQLFSKIPAEQVDAHFTYADGIITNATGVEPTGDDDPVLKSIAARIVIWFLSGTQQWNDQNKVELDRRRMMYEDAVRMLEEYNAPTDNPTGSAFSSDRPRFEYW